MLTLRIGLRPSPEAKQRLVVWLLFGVALGVTPIIFSVMRDMGPSGGPNWHEILQNGDLVLISAILTGGPIGELFLPTGQAAHSKVRRVFAAGSSLFLIMIEAGWYATIATQARTGASMDEDLVATGSLMCLAAAVVAGCCCIYLSSPRGRRERA